MKAIGKVIELSDDFALVSSQRQSACASCHNCASKGACHAELVFGEQKQEVMIEAINSIGARVGDTVELEGSTRKTLSIAMLIFLLPFVLTSLAYFFLESQTDIGAVLPLILIGVFVISFFIITKLVNKYIQNKNATIIVAILEENQNLEAE